MLVRRLGLQQTSQMAQTAGMTACSWHAGCEVGAGSKSAESRQCTQRQKQEPVIQGS